MAVKINLGVDVHDFSRNMRTENIPLEQFKYNLLIWGKDKSVHFRERQRLSVLRFRMNNLREKILENTKSLEYKLYSSTHAH